jgi:FtsZ-binding cell division protein ZapB
VPDANETTNRAELWLTNEAAFWRDPVTGDLFDLQLDEKYQALPADAVRLVPDSEVNERADRIMKTTVDQLAAELAQALGEVSGLRAELDRLKEGGAKLFAVAEQFKAERDRARRELEEAKAQAVVLSDDAAEHIAAFLTSARGVTQLAPWDEVAGRLVDWMRERWGRALPAVDESGGAGCTGDPGWVASEHLPDCNEADPARPAPTEEPGRDEFDECSRAGDCQARWVHAPECLARALTDAELENGVVPPDDELRGRLALLEVRPVSPPQENSEAVRSVWTGVCPRPGAGRGPSRGWR